LLRKNIALGTEIGVQAAKEMKNGALVSDKVMVKLIDQELNKIGPQQNWLLDGFPRTMSQAQTLDHTLESSNQPLNLVIHLNVPEDVILQRIMGK
jgi:adenylate kinase family enzyme